jgi:hypothetical protein
MLNLANFFGGEFSPLGNPQKKLCKGPQFSVIIFENVANIQLFALGL